MIARAAVAWGAVVYGIAAVLTTAAWIAVRRYAGRHGPARDTATLPDLMKEH